MKFALFYELTVPRPWDSESERRVFEEAIQQVRLADALGFNTVWVVEHHYFDEHSHASAPDLFLAACARETKNIRLGHGIAICVPEVNHPVRLAEQLNAGNMLTHDQVTDSLRLFGREVMPRFDRQDSGQAQPAGVR